MTTLSNLIALGPWYQIWGEFYDQPLVEHWFFVPILLLTLFQTIQTSSHDKLDDILLSSTMLNCFASPDEKKSIKLHNNLNRIKKVIRDSSSSEFMEFYSVLPDSLKERIYPTGLIDVLDQRIPLELI